MKFFVYIIESDFDGTFYTGQTNNLIERLKRHNSGKNKSTKSRIPYQLKYFETYDTRAKAMLREWELKKKYNTERKRKLIHLFNKENLNQILGL
ncbi:MAG: GIY-YIG nuclease family protein [Ignavibacteria bacterium]|nr:GIY-YIG nuclease family protein [Ignavibacteria bacterium]